MGGVYRGAVLRIQLPDRAEVGSDQAVEAELLAQQPSQECLRARDGYRIDRVVRRHCSARATFANCHLEREPVHFTQFALADMGRLGIATAFARAVPEEVFDGGDGGM